MDYKRCPGWHRMEHMVPVTNFGRSSQTKDGLRPLCKDCRSRENATRKDRRREYDRLKERLAPSKAKLGCYVYFHRDIDGTVVYIGKGQAGRAWDFARTDPNHSSWMADMILCGHNFVELQDLQLSDENALDLEAELIEEYQPKYNMKGL